MTPTDEGVRVFSGIWFNSDELQLAIDDARIQGRKVSVFIDPDQMAHATVLVPGVAEPIEVHLQMTAFASLTLTETLDLMAEWRRENPTIADVHDDRIMSFRSHTYKLMKTIGVERKLPRSYSTVAECQAKAKAVFAGARIIPGRVLQSTTGPENITRTDTTENVFRIGDPNALIEGTINEAEPEVGSDTQAIAGPSAGKSQQGIRGAPPTTPMRATRSRNPQSSTKNQ